jgi:hypothetical protein
VRQKGLCPGGKKQKGKNLFKFNSMKRNFLVKKSNLFSFLENFPKKN